MKGLLKKFQHGEKGFTLIELLVVIAILGILAAVAIPNLSAFMGRGQAEAKATELSIVQTALVAAVADDADHSIPAEGTARVIVAGAAAPDPGFYLVSDTNWLYTWDATGSLVTQTDP